MTDKDFTTYIATQADLPGIHALEEKLGNPPWDESQIKRAIDSSYPNFVTKINDNIVGYLLSLPDARNKNTPPIMKVECCEFQHAEIQEALIKRFLRTVGRFPAGKQANYYIRVEGEETRLILEKNGFSRYAGTSTSADAAENQVMKYCAPNQHHGNDDGLSTSSADTSSGEIKQWGATHPRKTKSRAPKPDRDDSPAGLKSMALSERLQKYLDRLKEVTGGMEWRLAQPTLRYDNKPKEGEEGYTPMTAENAYEEITVGAVAAADNTDLSDVVFQTCGKLKYPKAAVEAINEFVEPRKETAGNVKLSFGDPLPKRRGIPTLTEPAPIVIPQQSMRPVHLDDRVLSNNTPLQRKLVEAFEPVDPAAHAVWEKSMAALPFSSRDECIAR